MSLKKIVFGFDTPEGKNDLEKIIPASELSAINFTQSLSRAFGYLKGFEGIHGLRPSIDFRSMKFADGELPDFLEHICGRDDVINNTRVILSDTAIEIGELRGNERALFLVSSSNERDPKYVNTKGCLTFQVQMKPSWMGKFVFDYLLELYVANAIPAVGRFLSDTKRGGLSELYCLKSEFSQRQVSKGKVQDAFRVGRSEMKYACFFSVTRSNNLLFSAEHARRAVHFWDEFVCELIPEYATKVETVKGDLKAWRKVHGQISESKLKKKISNLTPGAHFIFKQGRSSQLTNPKITSEQVRTIIDGLSRNSNLNKGFSVVPADQVLNGHHSNVIHDLIDANFLQTFRVWVG